MNMMKISTAQLNDVLRQHALWVNDTRYYGKRAELGGAILNRADLRWADLRVADLHEADLDRRAHV